MRALDVVERLTPAEMTRIDAVLAAGPPTP